MDYINRLKRNVRLYYLIQIFLGLEFSLPIWVAFYTRYISFSELALLNAIQYALVMVLELPTGAFADLIGRKRTILLGLTFSTIAFFYVTKATTFSTFLISYILRSFGEALISGADSALYFDTLKEMGKEEEYPKYTAKFGALYRMALAVGSFFGGYLYTIQSGLPYILFGFSNLIAFVLYLFVIEPKIDTVKFTLQNYLQQTRDGFKQISKTAFTKELSIYYIFVGSITWSCLAYFNQPYASDVGYDVVGMGWLFGGLYLAISLAVLYLSYHKTIVTKARMYVGVPVLMCLALLPGVFGTLYSAPLLLFLILLAGSNRFTFLNKYINDEFDSKYRATAVSSLNMLVSLGVIVLFTLGGKVQDLYGTKIIFTALGILTLLFVLPRGIELAKISKK